MDKYLFVFWVVGFLFTLGYVINSYSDPDDSFIHAAIKGCLFSAFVFVFWPFVLGVELKKG